jgi:predicted HicB family RNase H-like nuclease
MSWNEEMDRAVRTYATEERVSLVEWVRELIRREIRRREAK